jgi:hypothetical protein
MSRESFQRSDRRFVTAVAICSGLIGLLAGLSLRAEPISAGAPVPRATEKPDGATPEQRAAHLQCKRVAQTIETYQLNPANPDGALPKTLYDLVRPPFGGTSLLRNNERDFHDQWGQMFYYGVSLDRDGFPYPLVFTVAPGGIAISNFGIGTDARPK